METKIKEKKETVPRVSLYEKTINEMEQAALNRDVHRSIVYQEACNLYLKIIKHVPLIDKFKDFVNKL